MNKAVTKKTIRTVIKDIMDSQAPVSFITGTKTSIVDYITNKIYDGLKAQEKK